MEKEIILSDEEIKSLICQAMTAREQAYAPYSEFRVGAAVKTEEGMIFSGCNIENASYGASNCAERTAIFKAVSEGYRQIQAVAIVGGMEGKHLVNTYPCGICRQVLCEFAEEGIPVILAVSEAEYKVIPLKALMPFSFNLKNI